MKRFFLAFVLLTGLFAFTTPANAQGVPERFVGKIDAPVVIDEYVSLTCPHCADFFLTTLPQIEKRYVETGKVRIVFHDFPLDGVSLKAAALARCMPEDMFFPFIRVLYENQKKWAVASNPDKILIQYARLGGLDEQEAQNCLQDPAKQNAIANQRSQAEQMFDVKSTPTFIFNNGTDKMEGAGSIDQFAATIDRMLAHSKKKK